MTNDTHRSKRLRGTPVHAQCVYVCAQAHWSRTWDGGTTKEFMVSKWKRDPARALCVLENCC